MNKSTQNSDQNPNGTTECLQNVFRKNARINKSAQNSDQNPDGTTECLQNVYDHRIQMTGAPKLLRSAKNRETHTS